MITPLVREVSNKDLLREDFKTVIDMALPLSASQFAGQLIQAKWGKDIDPLTALLVTLDYNYRGHPVQNGVQQGRVMRSQSLTHVLLSNYQAIGDGRFGENAFGLFIPSEDGPEVRVVDRVDKFVHDGNDNHETYEGIYRRADPQTYGPLTQIAIRPADFKKWVWELEFKELYRDYVHQAWPTDEVIVAPQACALRTAVKAAFVMTACLQAQENSLSKAGLKLARVAAGLNGEQRWEQRALEQLQTLRVMGSAVEVGRLAIYRYTSNGIWSFRDKSSEQIILYIPGNSSPLHEFADARALRQWIVAQGKDPVKKQALAAYFAEDDRTDGAFHAGVLTALEGVAMFPRQHYLKVGSGLFNNDGYWDPADYIRLDVASESIDPFAQLVLTMKQAAKASIETIRDDAQVNRDNLSAVIEPVVQWIYMFGPLALFVPGGDGLLALAGLIDAGYGLDQAVNGKEPDDLSKGVTRTVFGVLNALPVLGSAALELASAGTEAAVASAEHSGIPAVRFEAQDASLLKGDLLNALAPTTRVPVQSLTRVELLRGIGTSVESFSDEVLAQIGKVSMVDNDMLRLIGSGRAATPLLADTINRFKIDQDLQLLSQPAGQQFTLARAELFQTRYNALQYSDSEWVRLFQRAYPNLPKSVIEQMLERSGADIQASPTLDEARQMLKQLAGKATQYGQHVRLNRAYEGLYLQSMENPETDILVLHTLKTLPGWPKKLRIEVLDSAAGERILDVIGPSDASVHRRLIKVGNRYQGYDAQGFVRQDTDDIYHAVLGAFSEAERSALQLQPLDEVRDLKQKISQQALPRSELIAGLQRMDSELPFDAQGLRGGGYPATFQNEALSHQMVILQVQNIYPEYTIAQAESFLQSLGVRAQEILGMLKFQFEQLNIDLDEWVEQVAQDIADMDVPLLNAGGQAAEGMDAVQIEVENNRRIGEAMHHEMGARVELATRLKTLWQRRGPASSRVFEGQQLLGFKLDLGFANVHCLPALNAKFTEVVELSMQGFQVTRRAGLNDFLECFPNLRTLNMEGFDLRQLNAQGALESVLPPAIARMSRLSTLNLKSTRLVLTEQGAGRLSELVRLQALDLSDNPLSIPPLVLNMTGLKRLNLSNAGITTCPIGIPDQPFMAFLDLSNNRISRIAPNVLAQSVARDHVQLWGNPVTDEDSLRRLIIHRKQTGLNLWLSAPVANFSQPAAWLQRLPEERVALNRSLWHRLEAKPGGKRFLRVFEGLGRTADFQVKYGEIQERVWQVLSAAGTSDELWGVLSRDIALSLFDVENPFVVLTRLENRLRVHLG